MTKLVLVAAVVLAVVAACTAAPPAEFGVANSPEESEYPLLRVRRVTCDLLSAKGVVGDSACAANCLSMGKSGGSCKGGVCVCRRDSFKDLWKKRFG